MAQSNNTKKNRINEIVVLAFVIVVVALLVIHTWTDVVEIIDQSQPANSQAQSTATPSGPTPTASPRPTPEATLPPIIDA